MKKIKYSSFSVFIILLLLFGIFAFFGMQPTKTAYALSDTTQYKLGSVTLWGNSTGSVEEVSDGAAFNFRPTHISVTLPGRSGSPNVHNPYYTKIVLKSISLTGSVSWGTQINKSNESTYSDSVFSYDLPDLPDGQYSVTVARTVTYPTQQPHDETSTVSFYVDTTPPQITVSCGNYGFANSVTVRFNEGIASYGYNTGASYATTAANSFTSGHTFSTAGNYKVLVTDDAGNVSTAYFTVDKTAPRLSLSGVENGGFTNGSVSASWSTTASGVSSYNRANSNDTLTVKYSRSSTSVFPTSATTAYTAGTALTQEGNYLITITDRAGNTTSYTFTIDKTAPTLSLSGVSNDGFTNGNVSASWSTTVGSVGAQRVNSNDTLTVKYSRSSTSAFPTSATTAYTAGTALTQEGNYLIKISDAASNTTSYTFTIDKTAPTLSLSGVSNDGFTNGNVSASWSTTVGSVGAQRVNSNDALTVKYSCSADANFPSSVKTEYTATAALTAEGNYRIVITDLAGNSSSFVFTIDKTMPTFKLTTSDNSAFINNRTAKDVSVSWSTTLAGKGAQRTNSNDTLTVKYGYSSTSAFPESADTDCFASTELTQEGKYLITITDAAGNVYSKHFEIYRQPPTFIVLSASGEELSTTPLAYNKDIKFVFADCSARLNNKQYTSNTVISEEGEYSLVLTDELGNSATCTIYIIKHLPTANLDRFQTPINMWYETTNSNGDVLAFANIDNAMAVADNRERATITSGVWTATNWDGGVTIATEDLAIASQGMAYYVYKSYASANTLNAYFSISTLNKSIEKYVAASINVKYTPAIPAQAAEGEVVYRDMHFSNTAITFNRISNCTLFIDGTAQAYPYTLTSIGLHNIVETDIAGNTVSYTVILDTAAPIVRVTNLNGNMPQALIYGTDPHFTYALRIYLDDQDEQALLKINDDYYLGGVIELRAAGIYTISTRDAAGNAGNLTIYISLIEPTISIKENEVADVVNSFTIQIDKNYNLNNIDTLSILKYDDEENEWKPLSKDNSSSPVSIGKNSLTYLFDVSGSYRIIVYDVFGRHLEKEYIFIKGSPKGTLSTTGGTILTSGDSTKSNFYFTWSNLLDCSAEISVNGAAPIAYAKGTIITAEGSYTIKLYSNVDNVFNVYCLTIDKTAPEGTLTANGAELSNGSTTRHPVALSWTELGCTAFLNGELYANGSVIAEEGDYTIELSDAAGNKRIFTFRIKTTPPKITLSTTMGKISSYDVTKYDVYVSWTERNCTCLVNGQPYTTNTRINVENSYTVVLTDAYGNTNSCFFSIDKTAPIGQLLVDGVTMPSASIYTNKKVSFTWAELGCSAVINNDFIYSNGSIIAEDGTYTIKLSDAAGNTTEYFFVIKTTRPVAKLLTNGQEVSSGARTRFEARLTWTESSCTATVNGEPYSKGALITAEGDYRFDLFDSYGNSNSWQIAIDKTAPVIVLTSTGDYLSAGQITRYDVCYNWDDHLATATLNGNPVEMGGVAVEEGEYTLIVTDDVGNKSSIVFIIDKTAKVGTLIANTSILEDGAITKYSAYYTWNGNSYVVTLNGELYSKGTLITAEGDYTIVLTDRAGNVSSLVFTIDKTPAVGSLYYAQGDTNFALQNGEATNGDVYFDWEEDCTATVNGEPYSKGNLITAEGDYTIVLIDRAGNVANYSFKIDKTAPSAKAHTASNEVIEDNSITRYSIYFDWTESGCTATVNGELYSKGTLLSETGVYSFVLSDAVGNTINMTIEVYKIAPHAEIMPENDFVLPYLNDGFSITWEEDCTATVNGEPYSKGTLITAEGVYTFTLINKVGLEFTENIVIDRTPPVISVFDAENNEINDEVSLSYIYFDWTESGCTATVNGEAYKVKTYITKDGIYKITLTDAAGNSASRTVRVARQKPTIILQKSSGGELTNGGSTTASVVIILTSEYSATIKVDDEVYNYSEISEIGTHTVVVTDEFGNIAEYSFTIKEVTENQTSNNPFGAMMKGSSTGTYILISLVGVLIIILIVVPLIKTKRKNAFKNKLK